MFTQRLTIVFAMVFLLMGLFWRGIVLNAAPLQTAEVRQFIHPMGDTVTVATEVISSTSELFTSSKALDLPREASGEPIRRTRLAATQSFGGGTWVVTGNEDRIYFNQGGDLIVADISGAVPPREIGRWSDPTNKASISELHLNANYLYVPHGFNGVDILDVSNPQPVKVGLIPVLFVNGSASQIRSVSVSGQNAYLTQGPLLRVVDVTDPTSPQNTTVITPTGAFLNSIVIAGSYAYITAGSGGLVTVDISSPTNPTVVSTLPSTGYASYLKIVGTRLYLADRNAVRIIDISNPGSPVDIGSYSIPQADGQLGVIGNYLVVFNGVEIHIVDVSNPSSPTRTAILGEPDYFLWAVHTAGERIYAGTYASGIVTIDLSVPSTPSVISRLSKMPYARSVASASHILVTSNQELWWMRLGVHSITGKPIWASSMPLGDVLIEGNLAYVAEIGPQSSSLQIVDISEPELPILLGNAFVTSSGGAQLTRYQDYVYVGSWSNISAVHVANPDAPQETSTLVIGANIQSMTANNGYLYAATSSGLKILSINNPAEPTLQAQYGNGFMTDVKVRGNYLFLTLSTTPGFQILDITNPLAPVLIKTLNTCGLGQAVVLSDTNSYVLDGCNSVARYDMTSPEAANTNANSSVALPSLGEQIIMNGDRGFVADGRGGFVLIETLEQAYQSLALDGGEVTSSDQRVTVTVPSDTYDRPVWVILEEAPGQENGILESYEQFWSLSTLYTDTLDLAALPDGKTISVSLTYPESTAKPETLRLYRKVDNAWVTTNISTTVDQQKQLVTAVIQEHSGRSTYGLFAENFYTFLPTMQR